jgi:6-phosphofructokinase 1
MAEPDGATTLLLTGSDLEVKALGPCRRDSPLAALLPARHSNQHYVDEGDRVLLDDTLSMVCARGGRLEDLPGFEAGGPRRKIFFDPSKTRVGIVTCGGLCPGLNNVIRGLVMELTLHYGVKQIIGFRNGYQGFIASYGYPVVDLTPDLVRDIDEDGGTILGSSRGQQDSEEIVDCLQQMAVNVLFVIGGDGALHGAERICDVIAERNLMIAVVGVPKTIDNDIPYIDHSFGFRTAYERATESISAAQIEARSAPGGIGLVKLMGRHSGFIACCAALATNDADFVLIPEVPFDLDGEDGFLAHLRAKVLERGSAVVVVAEGAGQEHLAAEPEAFDASGNLRLHDIQRLLKHRISEDFAEHGLELNLKLLDPSYAVRSVPANAYDSVYCLRLAQHAVHAAMAGRTEVVVGRWHRRFVHVPIALTISRRSTVDPFGDLWLAVLQATGQPQRFGAGRPAPVALHEAARHR